jgi:hypothetical protein
MGAKHNCYLGAVMPKETPLVVESPTPNDHILGLWGTFFCREKLPFQSLKSNQRCGVTGQWGAAHFFAGSEVTSFVHCPGPRGAPAPLPRHPDRGLPVAIPYQYRIHTGGTSLNAGFKLVPPVPLATPQPPVGVSGSACRQTLIDSGHRRPHGGGVAGRGVLIS